MAQDLATRFGPDEAPAPPAHDVFAISMICLACLTDGKNGGAAGSEWVGGVTLREDQISVSHPGASLPRSCSIWVRLATPARELRNSPNTMPFRHENPVAGAPAAHATKNAPTMWRRFRQPATNPEGGGRVAPLSVVGIRRRTRVSGPSPRCRNDGRRYRQGHGRSANRVR